MDRARDEDGVGDGGSREPPPGAPFQAASLAWASLVDELTAASLRARGHVLAQTARALHGRPPIAWIGGPAHEHELVADLPRARLLRYAPSGGTTQPHAIVIVASLINKFYVLDLLPEISVIRGFQERGFPVWVLDWKAPGAEGPSLGFTDYVDGAIGAAVDAATARDGGAPDLLGYCMGGTMATMFAARRPDAIRSLALLAAPIDFHKTGILTTWTRPGQFDPDLVIDALGNMPPWLMQSGFKAMSLVDQVTKPLRVLLDGADEDRMRHVTALEAWLDDNAAFPGGVYRQYIKGLYQANGLVEGTFAFGGAPIELARITAPVLLVLAERDHICEPASSEALLELVSSEQREKLSYPTGHIGLTASKRTLEKLWPRVYRWFEARA